VYRADSFNAVSKELSRYKVDLVRVQEVRWERDGTESAGEYTFFYGNGNENYESCTGFFLYKRIISAVKSIVLVRDRILDIILRGL
jgi:hypothetical protein